MPSSNWMNDPNGPFYDTTFQVFHFFYQYLTPREWGHAISHNLVDWTILDVALNYSDAWYTDIDGEPGVYSGSATVLPSMEGAVVPWLSASVPTNNMIVLATPKNLSDPQFSRWAWDTKNPVIFAGNATNEADDQLPPPGRDPTEFWICGSEDTVERYCMAYATQLSEGCPCSNISGMVVFSAIYNSSLAPTSGAFSSWRNEGYLANDTDGAVMWECVDFYPIFPGTSSSNIWLLKYSIGPGPSYEKPWGNPGPRDYYVTGYYDPLQQNVVGFKPDPEQWDLAMARDETMSLDVGAFYASKTLYAGASNLSKGEGPERILWGWLPEERYTTSSGEPYGWAGVQSLPRTIIPYQIHSGAGAWSIRTPVLDLVLQQLRENRTTIAAFNITSPVYTDTETVALNEVAGQQLEITVSIGAVGMQLGDECGLRVLSSLDEIYPDAETDSYRSSVMAEAEAEAHPVEYTEVYTTFTASNHSLPVVDGVKLVVDPAMSCANASEGVNRTASSTASLLFADSSEQSSSPHSISFVVVVDHSVVESFLACGRRVNTRRVYPSLPSKSVRVQAFARCNGHDDCTCRFLNITAWTLRNATIRDSSTPPAPEVSTGDSVAGLENWAIALVVCGVITVAGGVIIAAIIVWKMKLKAGDSTNLLATVSQQ